MHRELFDRDNDDQRTPRPLAKHRAAVRTLTSRDECPTMHTGPKGKADRATLAEAQVAAVAATLNEDLAAVVGELHRRLVAEIEPLRRDESLLNLLRASIEANIDTFLHMLQYGISIDRVEAPPAAIEYAHRLAQHGVPVRALVRAYRLGQGIFLERSFEVLERQVDDPELVSLAAKRLIAITFSYIDRVTEHILEAYEDERDRWLQQRTAIRAARVRELLREELADVGNAEATVGYPILARLHLGLVVWTSHEELYGAGGSGLARFTGELAERLGCPASPLFLPHDQVTAWAWLCFGRQAPAPDELRTVVRAIGSEVAVAAGEPATGVAGFRRSHQQARLVQATMHAADTASIGVTTFDEVGPIALFCADLGATRTWVGETLGRLALDDEQHARLRETLRVFLATGGSYVAAAERLSLHRNSVYYRVRKAEEARGRAVEPDRLDVEIALKACRWLGRSVLKEKFQK